MKVLIIDDERLARDELRDLLHIAPDVEIVGEAAHAETARALIATTQPDLLLLDIQMPGPDGFTLLATLPLPVPAVIFVTAHDSHALQAFRVNALDYLLKPIEPDQLKAALARVRDHLACRHAQATVVPPGKLSAEDTVFVRDGERCWFVAIKNIRFAECVGNYCRLHMDAHRPLLLTTLDALAARLDPRRFVRASRSQLINLAWVARTAATPGGGIIATLLDGTAITFSRRAAREFRQQHRLHPHVKNPRPL
jgi:two-component system LytT family response regulator